MKPKLFGLRNTQLYKIYKITLSYKNYIFKSIIILKYHYFIKK